MHEMTCDSCAVRNRALCGALTREELGRLNAIARFRDVPAGHIIMTDTEPAPHFANVVSGVVKLTKTLPDGRQQIVGLQFPSNFLGRPFGPRSPFFAEAATSVRLCTYPRSQFESLLREFPGLEHRLFEHTLNELDAARDWMLLLGRKTAMEKVASFLLMVAQRAGDAGCKASPASNSAKFELPLTRTDIADFLGLTIETVSRQMSRLKSRGYIKLEGARAIIVPDVEKLGQLSEPTGQESL